MEAIISKLVRTISPRNWRKSQRHQYSILYQQIWSPTRTLQRRHLRKICLYVTPRKGGAKQDEANIGGELHQLLRRSRNSNSMYVASQNYFQQHHINWRSKIHDRGHQELLSCDSPQTLVICKTPSQQHPNRGNWWIPATKQSYPRRPRIHRNQARNVRTPAGGLVVSRAPWRSAHGAWISPKPTHPRLMEAWHLTNYVHLGRWKFQSKIRKQRRRQPPHECFEENLHRHWRLGRQKMRWNSPTMGSRQQKKLHLEMPGYVQDCLQQFNHEPPKRRQDSPYIRLTPT